MTVTPKKYRPRARPHVDGVCYRIMLEILGNGDKKKGRILLETIAATVRADRVREPKFVQSKASAVEALYGHLGRLYWEEQAKSEDGFDAELVETISTLDRMLNREYVLPKQITLTNTSKDKPHVRRRRQDHS